MQKQAGHDGGGAHCQDGHYYIHYDPSPCRSLTVREAARLQTFRTTISSQAIAEQYTQVGNAVPPLLAHKLAKIVRSLLNEMNRKRRRQVSDRANSKPMENPRRNAPGQAQVPLLAEAD